MALVITWIITLTVVVAGADICNLVGRLLAELLLTGAGSRTTHREFKTARILLPLVVKERESYYVLPARRREMRIWNDQ